MTRHFKFSLLVIFIFVFGLFLVFGGYGWFLNKQERVLNGLARPNFPYRDYNQEELNDLYPQYVDYSNVPDKQTPEQTHQKFLSALKKKDFTEAVNCCFREGDRERMKSRLEEINKKGLIDTMIGDLNRDFKLEMNLGFKATYSFMGTYKGQKVGNVLNFIKDSKGYWYIESL